MFSIIRSSLRQPMWSNTNNLLFQIARVRSKDYSAINITKDDQLKYISIAKHGQSVKYNYFWLRDHCYCKECFNATTSQRKLNILEVPFDITPETIDIDTNGVVKITWEGGHTSEYSLSWLEGYSYENYKKRLTAVRKLWTKDDVKCASIAHVSVHELLTSDECLSQLISSLVQYGVAFVKNIETIEETEAFAKRIGPVKNTLFGQMWEFSDSLDHNDTAYTKESLEPHTDNTYFSEASGLLILHCLSHQGNGGESTLVDGFKAVQVLKEQYPDVFERLNSTCVGAHYLENGQYHLNHAPAIIINPITREVEQIRFNEYDRSPLSLPFDKIIQYYEDFATLMKIIKRPEMIWQFKLNSGCAMVIDNFRLLHGRTAYTGKRHMCGCYVGRTDFVSKIMLHTNTI